MRVGRNETCPCGSGMKFKNCCGGKNSRASSRGLLLLLAVIAVIAAIGVYPLVVKDKDKSDAAAIPAGVPRPAGRPGASQPGPAPAGKVWSTEHGHWHDVPASQPLAVQTQGIPGQASTQASTQVPAPPPAQALTPAPQPPGPVPPGKVWSLEHGHWHDAPKQ